MKWTKEDLENERAFGKPWAKLYRYTDPLNRERIKRVETPDGLGTLLNVLGPDRCNVVLDDEYEEMGREARARAYHYSVLGPGPDRKSREFRRGEAQKAEKGEQLEI